MAEHYEIKVTLNGPVALEARISKPQNAEYGLIAAHPHPLYGGNLGNNVVRALCKAGIESGFATLRFNFRGVGESEGVHDNGNGEVDDLLTAVDYLLDAGIRKIVVSAYSFGSYVAHKADFGSRPVIDQIWVAPPVLMMNFDVSEIKVRPSLILCGAMDEYCTLSALDKLITSFKGNAPQKEIVEASDHFFVGFENWITEKTAGRLNILV
jgi:alpha/beta superfamily hydrolase